MPGWLILMIIVWFAMRMFIGRRSCGWHDDRRLRRETEAPPTPLPPRKHEDVIEEELRRRYVFGDMSVEDYERALDRLYRRA